MLAGLTHNTIFSAPSLTAVSLENECLAFLQVLHMHKHVMSKSPRGLTFLWQHTGAMTMTQFACQNASTVSLISNSVVLVVTSVHNRVTGHIQYNTQFTHSSNFPSLWFKNTWYIKIKIWFSYVWHSRPNTTTCFNNSYSQIWTLFCVVYFLWIVFACIFYWTGHCSLKRAEKKTRQRHSANTWMCCWLNFCATLSLGAKFSSSACIL